MSTTEIIRPADTEELRSLIADAAANGTPLEARSGGSKRDIGKPGRAAALVDLSAFTGIVDYEPSELVITLRPATPLTEVEKLLADNGQMLAFEPWDHGPLFGRAAGSATIGGVIAAGVAGPRRASAGGARDHLLGFTAVSGRAEVFKGGGKVVKNVTGYDVSKVMAGSWGQLALLTELSLKVSPAPRTTMTVALPGLTAPQAIDAMSRAMGSRCAPAAAAHVPGDRPLTAIRIEGFAESVELRARQLGDLLADLAPARVLDAAEADTLWPTVCEAHPLAASETLWRSHVAPSRAADFAAALERMDAQWFFDWAGALVWIGAPASAPVRTAAAAAGGHAMLVRAPEASRASTPARQPEAAAVAALSARLKQVFDPAGVLDPHRFA